MRRRITPRAGQFIFLRIGGDDAWREHPFTVTGLSPDGHLRLTIRSLGHDTARMHAHLQPGLPATVTGPYDMFDYTLGRTHQIWIAGGIGVAPFLSWRTALGLDAPYTIDLFYSTPTQADAVYLDELRAAQQRLSPLLRVHPVHSRTQGHLTGQKITATVELAPTPTCSCADPQRCSTPCPATCTRRACPATTSTPNTSPSARHPSAWRWAAVQPDDSDRGGLLRTLGQYFAWCARAPSCWRCAQARRASRGVCPGTSSDQPAPSATACFSGS